MFFLVHNFHSSLLRRSDNPIWRCDNAISLKFAFEFRRLFFGKNKVMALALGNSPQTEIMEGLHKLSKKLVNDVGVLFTNKPKDEVLK